MIPPIDIFQRIYQDVTEIKKELEESPLNEPGHEWIDIDNFPSNNHQIKQEEKKL